MNAEDVKAAFGPRPSGDGKLSPMFWLLIVIVIVIGYDIYKREIRRAPDKE